MLFDVLNPTQKLWVPCVSKLQAGFDKSFSTAFLGENCRKRNREEARRKLKEKQQRKLIYTGLGSVP